MNKDWKKLHELADEIGIEETLQTLRRVHGLSGSAGSLTWMTFDTFADILRAKNVVDEEAIYSADDWDGGIMLDRVASAYADIFQAQKSVSK